jgi:hypothetical protein
MRRDVPTSCTEPLGWASWAGQEKAARSKRLGRRDERDQTQHHRR